MREYVVRRLTGGSEELSCFVQLEDESAAMYFNIIHGSKLHRRFTTEGPGKACGDYLLIARELRRDGSMREREIALFDLNGSHFPSATAAMASRHPKAAIGKAGP